LRLFHLKNATCGIGFERFADSETMNVEADRKTLSIEDRSRLLDLLQHRPLQFCLFLSALIGQKEMEALIISVLKNA